MIVLVAALLTAGAVAFTLLVRSRDLREEPPDSPARHLEERRAQVYENLRDLQFEFRTGKLSEEDYQKTKVGLQKELARVMAQIDAAVGASEAAAVPPPPDPRVCQACGARFDRPMKFCGECGQPMPAGGAE
jgi:rRNA maturation endonuclease Nob1